MTAATAEPRSLVPSTASGRFACRVCGSTQMLSYLNLGKQPYANALQRPDAPLGAVAPLRVFACQRCQLSQLGHVALPAELYENYAYRSGVSEGWRKHCAKIAAEYARNGDTHIDIASNDGTLVQAMAGAGMTSIGVEPSLSFADCDYPRITAWWGTETVKRNHMEGLASVITAQNVLGHVHDVHDFMAGIKLALAPDGVALIEVPYVGDMLRTLSFDTVYHEHLSYWSVTALRELCNACGLTLSDVRPLALHGGSIRAVVTRGTAVQPSVMSYLSREQRDLRKGAYLRFSERVSARMAELNDIFRGMAPCVGFGAAAKTTVMLNCLDVRAFPDVVYDDNACKHGFAIPGTRVPIALPPTDWSAETRPMVLFSWNWADIIIPKLRANGYAGDIYVPAQPGYWNTLEDA